MKKIVFTVQVFALIAALPLHVITELNHVSTASPLTETMPEVTELNEKPVSMVLTDTTAVFETKYLAFKKQNNTIIKSN